MAYSQTKKISLTEKRLALLKVQLYGKEHSQTTRNAFKKNQIFQAQKKNSLHESYSDETLKSNPLSKDLTKIIFLAILALAFQFSLYLGLIKGILKF